MKTYKWIALVFSCFLVTGCSTVLLEKDSSIFSWTQADVVVVVTWTEIVLSETASGSWMLADVQQPLPSYIDHTLNGEDLQLERVLERTQAYIRYQISYLSDGLRISGIMNIPTGSWSFPLVILNHGYIDPAVYTNGRGLKREQDYLARAWFAVLHTDYRNHAFSDTDTDLVTVDQHLRTQKYGSDTLNAIVAVQKAVLSGADELLWVDADRVWMMWHSMGGGVTMYALVTHPELIDAAVLYAPVHSNEFYNFNRWLKQRLDTSWYTQLQDRLWDLTDIQTFASFSPETYFNRVSAPVQIYFWTADESCPVERWRAIRDALVQHDKQVELIEYVWEKHEFTTERQSFMAWVVVFFTEQLKK